MGATELSSALASITTAASDLSVANVVTVFVAGLAIAVPLVVVWFGLRFVWGKAKKAFTRGK